MRRYRFLGTTVTIGYDCHMDAAGIEIEFANGAYLGILMSGQDIEETGGRLFKLDYWPMVFQKHDTGQHAWYPDTGDQPPFNSASWTGRERYLRRIIRPRIVWA